MRDTDERGSYGQFCPVAMAAELLCNRWTVLVLRELLAGSTRFNDLRRGVPRMSPSLLSKRLKELEEAGVIAAEPTPQPGVVNYRLTTAGEDLRAVIDTLGCWGQRWVESSLTLKNLDPALLMWDMRRNLRTDPLPQRRCTIKFIYPELMPDQRSWWLVGSHQHRSLSQRSRLRGRSLCAHVAPDDDCDMDGPIQAGRRDESWPCRTGWRQGDRPFDSNVARLEPVRQRRAPCELTEEVRADHADLDLICRWPLSANEVIE